ncbi:MAG: pilus assembly protein [Planctomycetales bacterium]|nr:pilus assembly protein [Planctomycetales bacterium]
MRTTSNNLTTQRVRLGAALVELALALPLLFLVVFGAIQAANALFAQQFITEVSYQGAIAGSKPNATHASVVSGMEQFLTARNISGGTIVLEGVDAESFDSLTGGQKFLVRITIPPTILQAGPNIAEYTQLQAESYGQKQ